MVENRKPPIYTGLKKHLEKEAGYAIWVPSDWTRFDMTEDHWGVIYSPYTDRYDTCFMAERFRLKFSVTEADVSLLADAFQEGIMALDGVDVEEVKSEGRKDVVILEAKFTFLENGQRRKRWVRNLYWGNGQLLFIAQGETVEDFDYWLPMFFNTMMTFELA